MRTHRISAVARTALQTILCTLFLSSCLVGQIQTREYSINALDMTGGDGVVTLGAFDSSTVFVGVKISALDSAWHYSSGVTIKAGDTTLISIVAATSNLALGAINQTSCSHYTVTPEAVTVSVSGASGDIRGRLKIKIYYEVW